MKNKISVSLLSLKNLKDLELFLKILKKEDIKYIELPISKIDETYNLNNKKLINFRKLISKKGIKISALQSIFFGYENLNILEKKYHKKIILHFTKVIKIAKFFNVKNIIFGSPKNRFITPQNKKNSLDNAVNILKHMSSLCEKNDVFLCFEPNAKHYNCNFITNLNDAIELKKIVNEPNFKINIDTGNIFLSKEKIHSRNLNHKFYQNFQISEKNLKDLIYKKVPHVKILRNFDISNKFISLEMLNIDIARLKENIIIFKKIIKKLKK